MSVLYLILGVVLFVYLVLFHEFGHFIAARRNGVTVEEFGLGFPPRATSIKKKSGLLLSINWLPLGGFVRLKGEHDSDKGKGSFGEASLWAKTKIMAAGVGMNLLACFLILTFLALIGMPQLVDNQYTVKSDTKLMNNQVYVGNIESNSPASKIGLKSQDQIISFYSPTSHMTYNVVSANDLPNITKKLAGQTVEINLSVNGTTETKTVTLRSAAVVAASQKTNNPKGYLGIEPGELSLQRSTWSAPVVALGLMWQFTVLTFHGIGTAIANLFTGHAAQASNQVRGPVGVAQILNSASILGYQAVLLIIAIISLSLALINILPIPALDGGRLFFTLVPRLILRRPLKSKTEDAIHGTGMALLMLLFLLITVGDFTRIFHK
jgi:regulator of sigma E protease